MSEREPGRPVLIVTAEQLARGYMRRDGSAVTGPHPFVVLTKLDDGTFEVLQPPEGER